ncbi:CHAT domain-containing protein [Kitasatospora paracochleata]|uniref:CHAT domain-containing protein n=1 Tax=Kitasatospora paracochleata TaxID=58354 RepID=A0ABT1J4M7_9ACTN|nr:CHAT domain-containing protein [Kitasatospora paracochleata]MCP2312385.1 hypothetical protein [Kitasatospora paracochleata]
MDASTVEIADLLEHAPTPANPTPAAAAPARPAAFPSPQPSPQPSFERSPDPAASPRPATSSLTVTVVWGDLAEYSADIHLTGHYQDVSPGAAELALDRAVSAGPRRLITEHTRHGWIDATLGEVTYFPARSGTVRSAAVIGMGRMGTFTERRSVQLYESMLTELLALGHIRTVVTSAIGSGAGNLQMAQVARAMIGGFGAALRNHAATPGAAPTPLTDVFVVELDRLRAAQLLDALADAARHLPAIHVTTALVNGPGGALSRSSAAVYAVTGLSRLATVTAREEMARKLSKRGRRDTDGTPDGSVPGTPDGHEGGSADGGDGDGDPLSPVLAGLEPAVRDCVRRQLLHLARFDATDLAMNVRQSTDLYGEVVPVRISVLAGNGGLRWAALTERATVPERQVPVDADLLRQLVARLTGPSLDDAATLPDLLSRMVVPLDFQRLVSDEVPLELELDRDTAVVPWEFLTDLQEGSTEPLPPLAVRTPIARRLRTTYSRVVGEVRAGEQLRVLVIGDPGNPDQGMGLPGARAEALDVNALLAELGVRTRLFIGADAATGEPGVEPATRLDVLRTLLRGEYQIVHYCGHGTFDDSGPSRRSGWVFSDGLLSAQELCQLDRPPRMVVANACWSARLGRGPDGAAATPVGSPAATGGPAAPVALVPSLADEFLRAGVAHFIGAGWQVPDRQGITFARAFYGALLGSSDGSAPVGVGDAVKAAREQMFRTRDLRTPDALPDALPAAALDPHVAVPAPAAPAADPLALGPPEPKGWTAWAAYQHYGDPADVFGPDVYRRVRSPRESPR